IQAAPSSENSLLEYPEFRVPRGSLSKHGSWALDSARCRRTTGPRRYCLTWSGDRMNSSISTLHRRAFLRDTAGGMGLAALASLLNSPRAVAQQRPATDQWRGVIRTPHVPPRAKRVIWLYMAGGPSHLESFDYKPRLAQLHGQPMPESYTRGQPIAQLQGAQLRCFAPQHPFRKWGRSGQEIAAIFPHLGSVADELCIIRSLKTEAINHDPAHTF